MVYFRVKIAAWDWWVKNRAASGLRNEQQRAFDSHKKLYLSRDQDSLNMDYPRLDHNEYRVRGLRQS
jgi:hypothetical protein